MKLDADLAIIGGGPGGYVSAIRAAQGGLKVVLIEAELLGGTCLNRGCIPTKTLIHAAKVMRSAGKASVMGISFGEATLDLPALKKHKNAVVETLRNGVAYLLKKNNVDVVKGKGKLMAPGVITVQSAAGEREVRAGYILIATGSKSGVLPVKRDEETLILSSDQALDLTELPESILIVGGGAIGIEFAGIFNSFGCRVILVEALSNLLPSEDREMTGRLQRTMELDGITVYCSALIQGITTTADKNAAVTIQLKDKTIQETVAVVMAAVGRIPNSDDLSLEQAGIKTANGWILTDHRGETSVPGIFAVGDITGQGMLAHTAMEAGIRTVDHILGKPEAYNPGVLPRCVFYQTEYAAVGATEEQLLEKKIPYTVGRFPFSANGKALSMGETAGAVKVLAEADTGAVLGAHILGPQASTLISQAGLGLALEATLEDYALTVHAHPTISEALQEACLVALGQPVHGP